MELFVDNRIKRYSIMMLIIVCILFILFGYFVYREGKNVQLQNFEEIGKQYTNYAKQDMTDRKELAKLKLDVIRNHVDIVNFLRDPNEIFYRYKSELVVYPMLNDINGMLNIKLVPSVNREKSYTMGKKSLFDTVELIIPVDYLDGSNCYVSELMFNDSRVEFQMVTSVVAANNYIGKVYLTVDVMDVLQVLTKSMLFKETGRLLVFSEDDHLLYQPEDAEIYANVSIDNIALDQVTLYEIENKNYYLYLTSYEVSQSSTIYLGFIESEKELFNFNEKILRSVSSIVTIFVLTFALVVIFYGRYYSNQIHVATETAVTEILDSEVEKQTRSLKKIAETDSLTKLYNHGSIYKILEDAIIEAGSLNKPLTLMMLDVDYFKDVNDQYGHQIGDEVLKHLAKLFLDNIRDVDVAGRYGGEEFIILLRDTHLDLGYTVAERIRKAVLSTIFSDEQIRITISIGICEWKDEDVSTLIKKADKKLYDSKRYGRNKTTF
ncbi:MAG: GGDEF domain-containing protein [Clostridia bacterium]|nr:GGDEF domain-containing protein [Clostridia bacterium]